jgi:hypothetical protein
MNLPFDYKIMQVNNFDMLKPQILKIVSSSDKDNSVLCTIYKLRPNSRLTMQIFINIFSKGCFYSKNYVCQLSQID